MRRAVVLAVLAVALVAAAPAAADELVDITGTRSESTGFSVRSEGSVVVDWEGDPATCEPLGRCSMRGTTTWRLPPEGTMSLSRSRARGSAPEIDGDISLYDQLGPQGGEPLTTRVRDGGRLCADEIPNPARVPLTGANGGRDVAIALARGSMFSTRCPGPLAGDVAAALPRLQLPYAQLARGRTTLRLAGTGSFAAAGLRGTATSSVTLRIARPQRRGESREEEPEARVRVVQSLFRIADVRGEVAIDLAGGAAPGPCTALDSCGAAGTQRLAPASEAGLVVLYSVARTRVGRRAARAGVGLAPGGLRRGVEAGGGGGWRGPGRIRASVAMPGRPVCVDEAPLDDGALSFEAHRDRMQVRFAPAIQGPLRTRCAGPLVASGDSGLATADVPLSTFGRRRVELTFARARRNLLDDGWAASVHSEVTVVLERTRVLEQVIGG
ncbi:MAG TPA: hypothetical protein VF549_04185 [Solirubrobacteraceae bacterium]|jgi:hypothetical protein